MAQVIIALDVGTLDEAMGLVDSLGEGTDFYAIANNFVSVTPLQIDLTKYSEVKQVSDWLKDLDY